LVELVKKGGLLSPTIKEDPTDRYISGATEAAEKNGVLVNTNRLVDASTVFLQTNTKVHDAVFDWERKLSAERGFPPPRNQGACSSCWAYSITAEIEGQIIKENLGAASVAVATKLGRHSIDDLGGFNAMLASSAEAQANVALGQAGYIGELLRQKGDLLAQLVRLSPTGPQVAPLRLLIANLNTPDGALAAFNAEQARVKTVQQMANLAYNSIHVSQQNVLDCRPYCGCGIGCIIGTTYDNWLNDKSFSGVQDYPTKAGGVKGRECEDNDKIVHVTGIVKPAGSPSSNDLRQFLFDHGPVSTCVDASPLKYYTAGTPMMKTPSRLFYTGWKWAGWSGIPNHVVVAVGYNEGERWIRFRNSWGPLSGDGDGYFRLGWKTSMFHPWWAFHGTHVELV